MRFFVFAFMFLSVFAFSQSDTIVIVDGKSVALRKVEMEEKAATFPAGMTAFRQLIAENFNVKKVKRKGQIKCELTFIVERDGSITNIKATGENASFNKEAVNALSKVKEKWIPAEINEEKVRSRFKVPLTVTF